MLHLTAIPLQKARYEVERRCERASVAEATTKKGYFQIKTHKLETCCARQRFI